MFSIKIHSLVDLITNSSTTIYTWYDGSITPTKELLQEILKLTGSDENVNDVFSVDVFYSWYSITDLYEDDEDAFEFPTREKYEELIEDILAGRTSKPDWLKVLEERAAGQEPPLENEIYIKAKHPHYAGLEEKVKAVIVSADYAAINE